MNEQEQLRLDALKTEFQNALRLDYRINNFRTILRIQRKCEFAGVSQVDLLTWREEVQKEMRRG